MGARVEAWAIPSCYINSRAQNDGAGEGLEPEGLEERDPALLTASTATRSMLVDPLCLVLKPAQGLFLAAAALIISSCETAGAATSSIVSGHVTSYQCAVPPRSGTCQPTPIVGIAVEFQAKEGGAPFRARTDSTGLYSISLPRGEYVIDVPGAPSVAEGGQLVRIIEGPRQISISGGASTTADLVIQSSNM